MSLRSSESALEMPEWRIYSISAEAKRLISSSSTELIVESFMQRYSSVGSDDADWRACIRSIGQLIFEARFASNLKKNRRPILDSIKIFFERLLAEAQTKLEAGAQHDAHYLLRELYYLKPEGDRINLLCADLYKSCGMVERELFHLNNALWLTLRDTKTRQRLSDAYRRAGQAELSQHYAGLPDGKSPKLPFDYHVNAPTIRFFQHHPNPGQAAQWFICDSHTDVFLYIATHGFTSKSNMNVVVIPAAAAAALESDYFVPSVREVLSYLSAWRTTGDSFNFLFGSVDSHYLTTGETYDQALAERILQHASATLSRIIPTVCSDPSRVHLLGPHPPAVEPELINIWGKGPFPLSMEGRLKQVRYYHGLLQEIARSCGYQYSDIFDELTEGPQHNHPKMQYVLHPQDDHLDNHQISRLWRKKLGL